MTQPVTQPVTQTVTPIELQRLQDAYKGKCSKQGWPLGKYHHRIEMVWTGTWFERLKQIVAKQFGISPDRIIECKYDDRVSEMVILARLSLDAKLCIEYFVRGYKANA